MNQDALILALQDIVGDRHVAINAKKTQHYRMGWRSGGGSALAVVFPQSLLEYWRVLQAGVAADVIIIMQAANTGLTEGSTPSNEGYDRDIVIINTLAMDKLSILNNGEQVLSFPGTTLHTLEQTLAPLERMPHSVIGSSCLGASIVGGVANNSGGALVKRGPAYTELALFAQVNASGELQLINHLGIELGDSPEEILENLEQGNFDSNALNNSGKASASDYIERLRDVDAVSPSRFNADPTRLFEASGCAGKLAVFALRLDTFATPMAEQTFYVGSNDPAIFTHIRRHILGHFSNVPEVGEYIHRDMFDIAHEYGKDTFLSVHHLGTKSLPKLFSIKGRLDALFNNVSWLPNFMTDHLMQQTAILFPQHLPPRLLAFREQYEHHLIIKMSDSGIAEARQYFKGYFADATHGGFFECNPQEASKAYLHRFAAAGAAMRYQTIHNKSVGDILALDIALRRNDENWVEELPESRKSQIDKSLYYGHFFCHVFHQDYILKKGADANAVKKQMLEVLDSRGAKYPAEHNVGHLYEAEQSLKDFYETLDPTNRFNPGLGKMDKHKRNCSCC